MRKIALVTGGNSGIGYATARLLKQKEYEVFISGRNKERLEQAAGELGVDFFLADMSEPEDIKRLASNFSESGLDVLVNNAAIGGMIPLDYFTWEVFSKIFNTNVNGPLLLIKELLSALEKRGGSITTVSSISADIGASYLFLYASSKGAVNAFTRGLAVELAPRGIRVNAVAPGYVDTPMFEKVGLRPEQITELKKEVRDGNPLGRFGTPEEVGQVIVAQVEATYVTGSIWIVDGGLSISRGRQKRWNIIIMKKKKKRWADYYTVKAKKENYPARSVYKLQEIQKKYKIIKRGDRVLDLGCSPGSWLIYACHVTGEEGTVLGIDKKDMNIILPDNARIVKADIFECDNEELFGVDRYDVVMSDMAPDTTGNKDVDAVRSSNLCYEAFSIAKKSLTQRGSFLCKIFSGEDFKAFSDLVKDFFKEFKIFKPESCRKGSREIYIIGKKPAE